MIRLLTRNLMFAGLLGAAVFGPRVLSQQEGGFSLTETLNRLLKTGPDAANPDGDSQAPLFSVPGATASQDSRSGAARGRRPAAQPVALRTSVVRREILPLEQFLRFDVTPEWVAARFPRVSLIRQPSGEAMRVALISGTRSGDISGVLTYRFDKREMVQTITLHGATGDPTTLVAFVRDKYNLQQQQQGVYLRQWNRQPVSGLIVRRAPVLRNHAAPGAAGLGMLGTELENFEIHLELNRPSSAIRVSPQFTSLLND